MHFMANSPLSSDTLVCVCVAHILFLVISNFVYYTAAMFILIKIKKNLNETQNKFEMKAIKIDTRNCSFFVFVSLTVQPVHWFF